MVLTRDLHHRVVRRERRDPYHVMSEGREKVGCRPDRSASVATGRVRGDDSRDGRYYFFAAAARSTKVLPPFILCANGASLIWMTTASASTPRFFTSACVMSRIMPAFCSSVRPAAMLTVISGILVSLLLFVSRTVIVIAGPDPAIHHLKDGCAGQARA